MTRFQEFPSSVIEKLDYYIYLLIDRENKQVFYVGKGTGNRIFAHINAALKDETPGDKLDKIRSIRANGLEVKHVVHRHGLTEKEGFEVEAALIDFIGLSGLTNQVQGSRRAESNSLCQLLMPPRSNKTEGLDTLIHLLQINSHQRQIILFDHSSNCSRWTDIFFC